MSDHQAINVVRLNEADLKAVDALGSRYKDTIGFLTLETFRDYLKRDRVFGAKTSSGDLVGYLLFADYPDRFRIAQLCVAEECRGRGIARLLVDILKKSATTQKVIKLRCRRDFVTATETWRALGFIPLDEKPGRSAARLPLTLWCYQLSADDELGLWKAGTTEEVLDVVIDAQVFYDFDEEDSPSSSVSKGLLNDFLVDSLNFWITDELFLEIDRQTDDRLRLRTLTRAKGMNRIAHDHQLAEDFKALLSEILPYRRKSEKSDTHHIANTAASDIKTFVTRDEKILREADRIKSVTGVTVIHPVNLVSSLHEIAEKQAYSPAVVSGLSLRWRRMKGDDLSKIDLGQFQDPSETKGALRERMRVYLAEPGTYNCQILESSSVVVAIRVLDTSKQNTLEIPFARISRASETGLMGSFLIADSLSHAVSEHRTTVNFLKDGLPAFLGPILRRMEFIECPELWTKLNLCQCTDRTAVEELISREFCHLSEAFSELSDLDFDRLCAPLVSNQSIPTFLVPIKPSFAMGLIDNEQAANDLFGGDSAAFLRWENVYYRTKTRHKMLVAPARIIWYVSGDQKAIIGISHLDEVKIGPPKELFREYQKFGVLEWRDLYKMCGNDVTKEIMALKFSRTFLFRNAVTLKSMRQIFKEESQPESLQAPSLIPFNTLAKIFKAGFPVNSA